MNLESKRQKVKVKAWRPLCLFSMFAFVISSPGLAAACALHLLAELALNPKVRGQWEGAFQVTHWFEKIFICPDEAASQKEENFKCSPFKFC